MEGEREALTPSGELIATVTPIQYLDAVKENAAVPEAPALAWFSQAAPPEGPEALPL